MSSLVSPLSTLYSFNAYSGVSIANRENLSQYSPLQTLYKSITLSPEEHKNRINLLSKVYTILKKQYPKIVFHTFGSLNNSTAIVGSDIDVGFSVPASVLEIKQILS